MIKYIFLDVDGTFTDGGIYYDEMGNEMKKFCTKDGTGVICAINVGIIPIVITGRECAATIKRMKELHVNNVFQNVKNKAQFLYDWIEEKGVKREALAYIGDDINDIASMRLCGYVACPADAAVEVKALSNYVSTLNGGHGAVRDCIEHILKEEGMWCDAINRVFGIDGR